MIDNLMTLFLILCIGATAYFIVQLYNAKKSGFPRGTLYQYGCFAVATLSLAAILHFKVLTNLTIMIPILLFFLGNFLFKTFK